MVEVLALLISWAITAYFWHQNQAKYRNRIFLDKVNFSLNEIGDGKLKMRTLEEHSANEVWHNSVAVNKVAQAAKQTTETEPFLTFEDTDDLNFLKRCALNALSTRFANVFVARAVGLETKTKKFVYGITCEKYPRIRKQKIRVMVITEEQLRKYFVPDAVEKVDDEGKATHEDRLETLRIMGKKYAENKLGPDKKLGIIELGAPVHIL